MKFSPRFLLLAAAVATPGFFAAQAQTTAARQPVVITPPAIPDGSNASRAPFPAQRQFDDVKGPDSRAIDQNVPPNTPATNPEPATIPEPKIAVMQGNSTTTVVTPAVTPTGRTTVSVATGLDSARVVPTIRAGTFATRDQVVSDIDSRIKTTDMALGAARSSMREMGAAGQAQFKTAEDDIKAREKALRSSLAAARKASATEWENTRAQLAADYEAYAAALGRLDSAIGVTTAPVVR